MKNKRILNEEKDGEYMKQHRIYRILLSIVILLGGFGLLPVLAKEGSNLNAQTVKIATSADGTAINYYEHGKEGTTLVFVHGWSCDANYWREQVEYFKKKYYIVIIDLAGHGRSGSERENYTMEAFGQDVLAVVESIKADKVVLIGHSMGALVIAHAARLMPEKVIGLVAVDDLQNVEYPLGEEQFKEMTTPLKEDFKQGVRGFVTGMLRSDKSKVNEWVINDMSLADPRVALSAMNGSLVGYITGDVSRLFDKLNVRVVAVNSDLWPTDVQANRRHIKDFELIALAGLDHFMMLKAPERFNPALEQAVKLILLN
ncbi:MAG: alpha/beta hydrolase [Candidatus Riflebacteria bacterium]|nr:alpha/beta hydrolase [Candidatus Riflebacteria bacterium]